MPVIIRSIHTERKNPTPTPTVTSSTELLICGTDSASTCRSGSATVTAKPRAKLTARISGRFLVFVRSVPILLPIGVIDISAPSEKKPMPVTTITAPIRKLSSRSEEMGATVMHRNATMSIIGSTELTDSLTFSVSADLFLKIKPLFKPVSPPFKK